MNSIRRILFELCQRILIVITVQSLSSRNIYIVLFLLNCVQITIAEQSPVQEQNKTSETMTAESETCNNLGTSAGFCYDCYINKYTSELGNIDEALQYSIQSSGFSEDARYIIANMSKIATCPNRLWPDLILSEKPYIMLDKQNNIPIVATHKYCSTPSFRSPSPTEFKTEHLNVKHFAVTDIGNSKGIIVPVNSSQVDHRLTPAQRKEQILAILVHEAFHFCDQSHEHWKEKNAGDRHTEITDECTPRKYRAHIRYYLEKALKEKVNSEDYKTFLQQAAYWNNQYKENFPEEFKIASITDNIEGSAEFVGAMAIALAREGCQATDEKLLEAYKDYYFDTRGKYPKVLPTKDAESYHIGSLASALLTQSSSSEWQRKVEDGTSPVQLLFKGVSPLESSEIPEITQECRIFDNAIKLKQASVKSINQMLGSDDYIALSIGDRNDSRRKATIIRGHASKDLRSGYSTAFLDTSSEMDIDSSNIAIDNVHILIPQNTTNNCGNGQRIILVPRSGISARGSSVFQINVSGKKDSFDVVQGTNQEIDFSIKGNVTIAEQIEQSGADIWCVK